jgi:hypothetical protein
VNGTGGRAGETAAQFNHLGSSHQFSNIVPAGGGDVTNKVVYTTVYVDLGC